LSDSKSKLFIDNHKHFVNAQYSSLFTPYEYIKSSGGTALAILSIDSGQKWVTGCKPWQLMSSLKPRYPKGNWLGRHQRPFYYTLEKNLLPLSGNEGRFFDCGPRNTVCVPSPLKKKYAQYFIEKKIRDKKINHTRAVRKEEMGTCLVK